MKQTRRVLLVMSVFFVFLCASAASARAAEDGGAAFSETATTIFKWINFAIVAGGIIWVFAKVLPPKFRDNAESISSAITKATASKAEAERQLREAENKLANLQKEVVELRTIAEKESAAEVERIRAATYSDIQKIGVA